MLSKRVLVFNKGNSLKGDYVLYIPENSHRISFNFTLRKAIDEANNFKKPLLIFYPLYLKPGVTTFRNTLFLLEGLLEFKIALENFGLNLTITIEEPFKSILKFAERAVLIITDFPYLKPERKLWKKIAKISQKTILFVEGNVLIPVNWISRKQEPYARTLRPKILKFWRDFLEEESKPDKRVKSFFPEVDEIDLKIILKSEEKILELCKKLGVDERIKPVKAYFRGGYSEGLNKLKGFIVEKLPYYADYRSEPGYSIESNLSPYLRYGHISPIEILHEIFKVYPFEDKNVQSFFNELIVWRELARNFCLYNPNYDSFLGIPSWARKTLLQHVKDPRDRYYSISELEKAEVSDEVWRCAQIELLKRGKIHNYVRMYWCKRLLYWTKTPEEAFQIALYLNNKYALDGEDPNSYLGIAWCFGAFDHPFPEKKILGKVRSFTFQALRRKKSLSQYLKKWLD